MTDTVLSRGGCVVPANCREAQWPLENITLAGLTWPGAADQAMRAPVLMVHGWLDNAMSFARLGPELANFTDVHAIDLAGHGHSGHRAAGSSYWLMDYVADLSELVDSVFQGEGQQPVDLVGHSLGGIVCALYAAACPENVRNLVMIDSLGALSRPAAETIPQLRRALQKKRSGSAAAAVYPDIASAARIRQGGLSPLSPAAATLLVPRNMRRQCTGYVWQTDARLRHPAPMMMTEEQVKATLKSIQAPTLFVRARDGLLANRRGLDERAASISDLTTVDVPGGHHCHLDGDTTPVATAIKGFLFND